MFHECEFRAFVFDGDIIGKSRIKIFNFSLNFLAISQRNLDIFDSSLLLNSQSIITKISTFHDKYFHNLNLSQCNFEFLQCNN